MFCSTARLQIAAYQLGLLLPKDQQPLPMSLLRIADSSSNTVPNGGKRSNSLMMCLLDPFLCMDGLSQSALPAGKLLASQYNSWTCGSWGRQTDNLRIHPSHRSQLGQHQQRVNSGGSVGGLQAAGCQPDATPAGGKPHCSAS